jgi:glycosyltransferase involved in cell wall biosynthesis
LPGRLVVSLTSYPKRFDVVHYTLRSLLNQSTRADAVMLWIAHADRAALPQEVLALQDQGIEIRYCDDLRSYKKIIPLLQEAEQEGRDDFVVTVDDDTYYPPDWLGRLATQAAAHPGRIVAHRAHEIRLDSRGVPRPYRQWNKRIASMRGREPALIFPTGVGGVLYPPGSFHPDVTDQEKFLRFAPLADDVWLYWMWRMNGKFAQLIEGTQHMPVFAQWPSSQASALRASNAHRGGNDAQIQNMVAAFGVGALRS